MNKLRYSPLAVLIGDFLGEKPHLKAVDIFDIRLQKSNSDLIDHSLRIIKGIDQYLKEKKVTFIVGLIPHRIQVEQDTWEETIIKYGYSSEHYDLLFPNEYVQNFLKKEMLIFSI